MKPLNKASHKQDSAAYLQMCAVVTDNPLEYLWVHESAIEKGSVWSFWGHFGERMMTGAEERVTKHQDLCSCQFGWELTLTG